MTEFKHVLFQMALFSTRRNECRGRCVGVIYVNDVNLNVMISSTLFTAAVVFCICTVEENKLDKT
jgi:hypothetical protein